MCLSCVISSKWKSKDQAARGPFLKDVQTHTGITLPASHWFILWFQLRAHAEDLNSHRTEDPVDVLIRVVDVNDNRPQFEHQTWNGTVSKASRPGECTRDPRSPSDCDQRRLENSSTMRAAMLR